MTIGGSVQGGKRLIVESNHPYRGLVDSVVDEWVKKGRPMKFKTRHDYLVSVTVEHD